ncbi:MAG: hypothetical protein WKG06_30290 [Segetibacter sp.]
MLKNIKVSREDQDEYSYHSHQKALNAIKNGYFKAGILPITVEQVYLDEKGKKQKKSYVVDTDEGPREDTSLDALSKLKPVFAAGGVVTAGNSSQTSDGASFVIVMGEKMVKELELTPLGSFSSLCKCRGSSENYGYRTGGCSTKSAAMQQI